MPVPAPACRLLLARRLQLTLAQGLWFSPARPRGSVADAFDEMRHPEGGVRPAYAELATWLGQVPPDLLERRRREAELLFRRIGITFAVYGDADAQERLIPFDVIPRVLSAAEWSLLQRGLEQRVKAINVYINDIYGNREILRAGVLP